ncbi:MULTISPECIES: hypothetical protein [unclassified Microcoleus]|uniref:hypothetical protein n=1 Tax=unclassified Microcoleus TaxID=2642155 RepID=UPI002FD5ADD8
MDSPELLKAGLPGRGRRGTSDARSCPVLVWSVVEFFNYRLTDKLYSIGYFPKQRAVGFREPDVKTFVIVFNTLPAKLSRI